MWALKMIRRNAGRHKLRTLLTILGMAVAIIAFILISTLIDAFYKSAEVLPPDRLVTRHAVSFIFELPMSYYEKIKRVDGVEDVCYGNWFGGTYKDDPKNFFASVAIGPDNYFDIYAEYIIPEDQKKEFYTHRNSCMAGVQLANRFGWKIGDVIRLTGQIYPGEWEFVLRAIYKGDKTGVDENTFYFHSEYLDEELKKRAPMMAGSIGWYIIKINDPERAPEISEAIDELFANSAAETLTETEKAFTLNFMATMDAIINGMRIISFMIIGVILMVLANTMAMSARERTTEYAVLKTLGFKSYHITGLIFGESMLIGGIGGALGVILTFPILSVLGRYLKMFFNQIEIGSLTLMLSIIFTVIVALIAALFPVIQTLRVSIVNGLRKVG